MTTFNFILEQRLTTLRKCVELNYEHLKIVHRRPIPDEFEFELKELRLQLDRTDISTTLKMGNLYKFYDKIRAFIMPTAVVTAHVKFK